MFLKILCGIGIVVIAFIIFYAGVTVGFHKATFGRAWAENYERNFGFGPDHSLSAINNFPNADGAIGKIIKIETANYHSTRQRQHRKSNFHYYNYTNTGNEI